MHSTEFRRTLAVVVLGVAVLAGGLGLLAASLSADSAVTNPTEVRDVGPPISTLHAAGLTGENVTVGVVDVTGFDATAGALQGRVAETRAFGSDATVYADGSSAHGTAAAETVAHVAPDADLYLATFDSPASYRRAVEWLVSRQVDVVVAPVSFYGMPDDGTSSVAEVAERATDEGTVFVSPAGNLARGHWESRDRSADGASLAFGESKRNYLQGDGRDVTIWLSWDRAHGEQDYTAELYWTDGSETRLVARSIPYHGDGVPNERIVARVQSGTYYVTVRGPPNATGARVELSSPTHAFRRARPNGSVVAPASASAVLSVGAYDSRADRVEPYSSRGPTPDGRNGVDVVAPSHPGLTEVESFDGSSAAAAYTGGIAALVLDANPRLSPSQVERRLERAARDVGDSGPDPVAGHGLVRPLPAVGVEDNATG